MIITVLSRRGPAYFFSDKLCTAGCSLSLLILTARVVEKVFLVVALATFLLSYNVEKFSSISIFATFEFSALNFVKLVSVVLANDTLTSRTIDNTIATDVISTMQII